MTWPIRALLVAMGSRSVPRPLQRRGRVSMFEPDRSLGVAIVRRRRRSSARDSASSAMRIASSASLLLQGRRVLAVVACAAVVACSRSGDESEPLGNEQQLPNDGASYWPGADWRTARPAQVGLDASVLDALVRRLRSNAIPSLHSLII